MKTELRSVAELESKTREFVSQVQNADAARIALTSNGEVVAGLVSSDDLKALEELENQRARDWARLRAIRETYFKGVPSEELLNEALETRKEAHAAEIEQQASRSSSN